MNNALLIIWLSFFGFTVQKTQTVTVTYEDVKTAIKREFGSDWCLMQSIFRAESGLKPDRLGDSGKSVGIAQIHIPAHRKKIPGNTDTEKEIWLKNFQNNLKLAKQIRDKSGLTAWSVYNNESYLVFYNQCKGE